MWQVVQVTDDKYDDQVRKLLSDYFEWVNDQLGEEFGIRLDIQAIIKRDFEEIDIYLPPHGSLLLAKAEGEFAGIIFLTKLREGVAEIRRMFVRPQYRRQGIGRVLFETAVQHARKIGYSSILLESPVSWKAAHSLYKSAGFKETEEYPESEVPEQFREHWVFMELQL